MKDKSDIISRMEAAQQRFGRLQLEDHKPSYWDRIMSDPNRKDRYDDAMLEAHMEAQRAFNGEDAEIWQEQSERQGAE